jgi:hypothetical protein
MHMAHGVDPTWVMCFFRGPLPGIGLALLVKHPAADPFDGISRLPRTKSSRVAGSLTRLIARAIGWDW